MKKPTTTLTWFDHLSPKIHLGFVFFAILTAYAFTCAHTVTMEDSGEFLVMAHRLGIAHPPGYPLFILLGHLATYLPLGSIAFRIHLMDSILGALSCVLMWLIVHHLTRKPSAALFAALMFGFAGTLWSQSIIAEVYAFNTLFFCSLFWLALLLQTQFTRQRLICFSFLAGLSLTNSWPLMGLCTPVFVCLLWPRWREIGRSLPLVLPCLGLGLVPYLFLWWRSHHGLTVSFYGPILNFSDLMNYALRRHYAADDQQKLATLWDALQYHLFFWQQLAGEFTWFGIPIALFGFSRMWRETTRTTRLALLFTFLSTSVFLLFLWRLEHSKMGDEIYYVFHIIPFVAVAILLGWGAATAMDAKPHHQKYILILGTLLVLLNAGIHAITRNMNRDTFAADYAEMVLQHLPEKATLLTWGDADAGPIAYLHESEHLRPDLTVASQFGTMFQERIMDAQEDSGLAKANKLAAYVRTKIERGERVFATQDLFVFQIFRNLPLSTRDMGAYVEIVSMGTNALPLGDPELARKSRVMLDRIEAKDGYQSNWSYLRDTVIKRLCATLYLNHQDHPLLRQHFGCRLMLADHWMRLEQRYSEADAVLSGLLAETQDLPMVDRLEVFRLFSQNRLRWIQSQPETVRLSELQRFTQDAWPWITRYPVCENPMALDLLRARQQIRFPVDLKFMAITFGRCGGHYRELLKKIN